MTTPMTCDQFADQLAEYLDGDVDATTRIAMETHASSCGECGALLADVRKIQIDAANLPELEPTHDLWSGIAARIEAAARAAAVRAAIACFDRAGCAAAVVRGRVHVVAHLARPARPTARLAVR